MHDAQYLDDFRLVAVDDNVGQARDYKLPCARHSTDPPHIRGNGESACRFGYARKDTVRGGWIILGDKGPYLG